jgi:hypothetical protein
MIHPIRRLHQRREMRRYLKWRGQVAEENRPDPDDLVHAFSGQRFKITKRLARDRFVVKATGKRLAG